MIPLYLCLAATFSQSLDEDAIAKKVYAHLLIKDEESALEETQRMLKIFPESKMAREVEIKVLAKMGLEKRVMEAWEEYVSLYPEEALNRDLLEVMAWGIVEKGNRSASPIIRIFSLIAALEANDAKSVSILCRGLNDTNSLVRQVAVDLSSEMRDSRLCETILKMLSTESCFNVRNSILEAVGRMQIHESEDQLLAILNDPTSPAEEKAIATESLQQLLDDVSRIEIENLATSDRRELRILSAELVIRLRKHSELDLMIKLLNDPQAPVRKCALQAIGILRASSFNGTPLTHYIAPLQNDHDPEVAILAAHVMALNDPTTTADSFKKWVDHKNQETRIFASAVLASLGKYGFPYTLEAFQHTTDPYVKMNLGMTLIAQRIHPELGLDALYEGLKLKEKWMSKTFGVFTVIAPSDVKHKETIANYPEVVNQLTRLEVINTLAIMRHPKAEASVSEFLKERSWGITGVSAALLLTEGDETAIDIVRELLNHSFARVKIQTALILALWGSDKDAISTLQEAYPQASRELKEQILEGLGRIGEESVIPFLVKQMGESYQSLRLIAASSVLKCLYH